MNVFTGGYLFFEIAFYMINIEIDIGF